MRTVPTGFDISSQENAHLHDGFRDYSQYLIGLSFAIAKEGCEPTCSFRSGFLMDFEGGWYWITAGHVMNDINEAIRANCVGRFRFVDCYGFGPNNDCIPFDYEGAWKFHIHDENDGLDFGAVRFSPFYRNVLEKNRPMVVDAAAWRSADHTKYSTYVMLGLPYDSFVTKTVASSDGCEIVVNGRGFPRLIMATKAKRTPGLQIPKTPHTRLIARISKRWPQGDVRGMSGGPILGVDMQTMASEVVAVQSGWFSRKRIITACPIAAFAPMIAERIARDRR